MHVVIVSSHTTEPQTLQRDPGLHAVGTNPQARILGTTPRIQVAPILPHKISSHSELTIGSPKHDFIDNGKSRMKRHAPQSVGPP